VSLLYDTQGRTDGLLSQSIELIPGDGAEIRATLPASSLVHAPCIFIDGHLGVPQKVLFRAYMFATKAFFRIRRAQPADADAAALLSYSSVILLANPAHNTALNVRKRSILDSTLSPQQELHYTSLLLAGVKDAAKQDGLWHHRRWLLSLLYPTPTSSLVCFAEPPAEVWSRELALISRACELYPRNYHAWTHRTLCMHAAASSASNLTRVVARDDIASARSWIESHVSDASAAHHICTLVALLSQSPHASVSSEARDTINHALELVHAYPKHESLWFYLRSTLMLASASRVQVIEALNDVECADPAAAWNKERFLEWHLRRSSRVVEQQR
jgi:protein prenyltransferase alpha subunit repeat containing protein 1